MQAVSSGHYRGEPSGLKREGAVVLRPHIRYFDYSVWPRLVTQQLLKSATILLGNVLSKCT